MIAFIKNMDLIKVRHKNSIINILYNKQFEQFCLLYKTL